MGAYALFIGCGWASGFAVFEKNIGRLWFLSKALMGNGNSWMSYIMALLDPKTRLSTFKNTEYLQCWIVCSVFLMHQWITALTKFWGRRWCTVVYVWPYWLVDNFNVGRCACRKSGHPYTCGDFEGKSESDAEELFVSRLNRKIGDFEGKSKTGVDLFVCFYVFNVKIETCTFITSELRLTQKLK
jgi:hypothetical protein